VLSFSDTEIALAVLTAIAVLIACGLVSLTRVVARVLRAEQPDAPSRFRWLFAVAWRAGCLLVLLTYLSVEHLRRAGINMQAGADDYYVTYDILLLLAIGPLLSGAGHTPTRIKRPDTSLRRLARLGKVAVFAAIATSGYMLIVRSLDILYVVYIALNAMEMARPLRPIPLHEGIDPLPLARAEVMFWCGIAAPLVALNFLPLWHIFKAQAMGLCVRRMRIFAVAALTCSTLWMAWVIFGVLPNAAPDMSSVYFGAKWRGLLFFGLPCLLGLSGAIAYRLARSRAHSPCPPTAALDGWTYGSFWHENRLIPAALLGLIVAHFWPLLPYWWQGRLGWPEFLQLLNDNWDSLLIFAGVFLLSIQAAVASLLTRKQLGRQVPPELPPGRFFEAWVYATVCCAISVVALVLFGFSIWLAPWYLPFLQ
jgi:hypothetical protein